MSLYHSTPGDHGYYYGRPTPPEQKLVEQEIATGTHPFTAQIEVIAKIPDGPAQLKVFEDARAEYLAAYSAWLKQTPKGRPSNDDPSTISHETEAGARVVRARHQYEEVRLGILELLRGQEEYKGTPAVIGRELIASVVADTRIFLQLRMALLSEGKRRVLAGILHRLSSTEFTTSAYTMGEALGKAIATGNTEATRRIVRTLGTGMLSGVLRGPSGTPRTETGARAWIFTVLAGLLAHSSQEVTSQYQPPTEPEGALRSPTLSFDATDEDRIQKVRPGDGAVVPLQSQDLTAVDAPPPAEASRDEFRSVYVGKSMAYLEVSPAGAKDAVGTMLLALDPENPPAWMPWLPAFQNWIIQELPSGEAIQRVEDPIDRLDTYVAHATQNIGSLWKYVDDPAKGWVSYSAILPKEGKLRADAEGFWLDTGDTSQQLLRVEKTDTGYTFTSVPFQGEYQKDEPKPTP